MMGGGEFIINGAERVVVSQLHRSARCRLRLGAPTPRPIVNCRLAVVIPERGSWIEFNVTKKDALTVRIDQSGKFAATTLLRAMDPKFSTDADILQAFYPTRTEKDRRASRVRRQDRRQDCRRRCGLSQRAAIAPAKSSSRPATGLPKNIAETICTAGVKSIECMESPARPADLQHPGGRQHGQPRRGAAADLPAIAPG